MIIIGYYRAVSVQIKVFLNIIWGGTRGEGTDSLWGPPPVPPTRDYATGQQSFCDNDPCKIVIEIITSNFLTCIYI